MANVQDVASYIVSLRNFDDKRQYGVQLTNTKLQLILYYCQCYYISLYKELLFIDEFFAGSYGPKVETVYKRFSVYGRNDIPSLEGNKYRLSVQEMKAINVVWEKLRSMEQFELVNIVHKEKPWIEGSQNNGLITTSMIEDFLL